MCAVDSLKPQVRQLLLDMMLVDAQQYCRQMEGQGSNATQRFADIKFHLTELIGNSEREGLLNSWLKNTCNLG